MMACHWREICAVSDDWQADVLSESSRSRALSLIASALSRLSRARRGHIVDEMLSVLLARRK